MQYPPSTNAHSSLKVHVIRLTPHEDLKQSLQKFAVNRNIRAGIILSCAGSLENYHLRFANQPSGSSQKGYFEIVSLTGTLSHTSSHLHISVSDQTGATIGGHLLDNNLIYTTAEIAIGELTDIEFIRVQDPATGYPELQARSAH